jgi:hypothetical protein
MEKTYLAPTREIRNACNFFVGKPGRKYILDDFAVV